MLPLGCPAGREPPPEQLVAFVDCQLLVLCHHSRITEGLATTALPSALAPAAESGTSSSSSPVAIRISLTAAPITSAARFSPRRTRGIYGAPFFRTFVAYPIASLSRTPVPVAGYIRL